jgi:hypothetical protein
MKLVDATLRLFAPSQALSKRPAGPSWLRRGSVRGWFSTCCAMRISR